MPKTPSEENSRYGDGRSSPGSGEEGVKPASTGSKDDSEGAADLQPDDVENGDPAR